MSYKRKENENHEKSFIMSVFSHRCLLELSYRLALLGKTRETRSTHCVKPRQKKLGYTLFAIPAPSCIPFLHPGQRSQGFKFTNSSISLLDHNCLPACPACFLWPIIVCAHVISCFSCVRLFVTLWTVACQAPLSMEFSRQEYWSGLPFPPPGDLPNTGIESTSLMSSGWVLYHQHPLGSFIRQ